MAKSLVLLGSGLWIGQENILGVLCIISGCIWDIMSKSSKPK
jgi:hypothetical protein